MTTSTSATTIDPVLLAAAVFDCLERRGKRRRPDGTWTDKGRFLLSEAERQPCCRQHLPTINRIVSRRDAGTVGRAAWTHCLGYRHVAHVYGVPERALTDGTRLAIRRKCHSVEDVAALFGVSEDAVRRADRKP